MEFNGKTVLVVGMAKSGIASARLLLDKGADVTLYDAKSLDKFEPGTFDEFNDRAVFAFGENPETLQYDMMVLSPGVPTSLEFIQKAVRGRQEGHRRTGTGVYVHRGRICIDNRN